MAYFVRGASAAGKGDQRLVAGRLRGGSGSGSRRDRTRQRFYRPHDLPGSTPPIQIYGPDVVHLDSGEYVVLEDNERVPSGVAYSEAIRRAGMETMPEVYEA